MDDASKERIRSTATQTKILRAIATYAKDNTQPSLASAVSKERLLTAILENLNYNTEQQLICELVNAIEVIVTDTSILRDTLESAGYISGIETEAFNKGNRIGGIITKKVQAKVGGKAKAAKYFDPLKTLAFDLASIKNYPSKNQAAQDIAPQILAESRKLGLTLSKNRIVKTITEWLAEKKWKPSNR